MALIISKSCSIFNLLDKGRLMSDLCGLRVRFCSDVIGQSAHGVTPIDQSRDGLTTPTRRYGLKKINYLNKILSCHFKRMFRISFLIAS